MSTRLLGRMFWCAFAVLAACGKPAPTSSPADTVSRLLARIANGDSEGARSLLVAAERDDSSYSFSAEGLAGGYEVGGETIDGDRAVVMITLRSGPVTVPQVCRREQGSWRVSLAESMQAATGVDMKRLESDMQRSMQQIGTQLQPSEPGVQGTHATPR